MGFSSPGYKLKWPEGHELHGLEVRTTGLTIAELEDVAGFRKLKDASDEERQKFLAPMIAMFARHLTAWNWEHDDGSPVGTGEDAMRGLDSRQLLPVILTWMQEVSSIPTPLPEGSPSGQPFQVALPPTDLPSPNLTSLPMPA